MSLLAAFLSSSRTGVASFPGNAPFSAACARPSVPWSVSAGAASPASSGPTAARTAVGAPEYFLYSRCQWEPQRLFQPILQRALSYCPQRLVGVAVDDTRLRKTGRAIPQAFYQRDPLSPPFHLNLVLGLRFLQASLLVPLAPQRSRRYARIADSFP
jgi:hypothetical protein